MFSIAVAHAWGETYPGHPCSIEVIIDRVAQECPSAGSAGFVWSFFCQVRLPRIVEGLWLQPGTESQGWKSCFPYFLILPKSHASRQVVRTLSNATFLKVWFGGRTCGTNTCKDVVDVAVVAACGRTRRGGLPAGRHAKNLESKPSTCARRMGKPALHTYC